MIRVTQERFHSTNLETFSGFTRLRQIHSRHQISNDFWDQVELNAVNVEKYLDHQGWLTRDDFVKIAQDHKLLELNERQGVTG